MLSGVNGASPWAADASEGAVYLVEVALGQYSSGLVAEWSPSDEFDHDRAVSSLPDHPNVWTDGSLVLDRVTDVSSSGAGFFAHQSDHCWRGHRWGHVDGLRADDDVSSCRGFFSVPGPLQSAQLRCGVSFWPCSLLMRFTWVGRLLGGSHGSTPSERVNDGDLLLLIQRMLHLRGLDTVRITKVKEHADDAMVLDGRVKEDDRLGNDAADEAADFGRRRVGNAVIDARRNLSGVCGRLVSCRS